MPLYSIEFNFHPDGVEGISIPLAAIAEFDESKECYVVHSFHIKHGKELHNGHESALPVQFIKRVQEKDGFDNWVHSDSEKSSHLSLAIGAALFPLL